MLILGKKALRKNIRIRKIDLSEADSKKINNIMNTEVCSLYRKWKIKAIIQKSTSGDVAGGSCCLCRNLPEYVLNYRVSGCTIIEKYCTECLTKQGGFDLI